MIQNERGNPVDHIGPFHALKVCMSYHELSSGHMKNLYRCFCVRNSSGCGLVHYQEWGSADEICSLMSHAVYLVGGVAPLVVTAQPFLKVFPVFSAFF